MACQTPYDTLVDGMCSDTMNLRPMLRRMASVAAASIAAFTGIVWSLETFFKGEAVDGSVYAIGSVICTI